MLISLSTVQHQLSSLLSLSINLLSMSSRVKQGKRSHETELSQVTLSAKKWGTTLSCPVKPKCLAKPNYFCFCFKAVRTYQTLPVQFYKNQAFLLTCCRTYSTALAWVNCLFYNIFNVLQVLWIIVCQILQRKHRIRWKNRRESTTWKKKCL